jgi:uncharacterized membrane protein
MHKMLKTEQKVALIYALIASGSVLCLATIFLAPLLKNQLPFLSDLIYVSYSPLCHQIPSRCFVLSGYPMAVCTRCLGVYGGFLLGVCFYPVFMDLRSRSLPPKEVIIVMSAPIVIDTAGNLLHFWMTNEWIRLLTGILWGSMLPFFLIPGMMDLVHLWKGRFLNKRKRHIFQRHIDRMQEEAK